LTGFNLGQRLQLLAGVVATAVATATVTSATAIIIIIIDHHRAAVEVFHVAVPELFQIS
jgi:hypothetical protein